MGAHNGTLESKKFRPKDGKTDSQMFLETMSEEGIIPTLESTDYWDAWAVSIYQKDSGRVYLARNRRRPLAIAICKMSGVMFWASEHLMLHMIMARNNIDVDVYILEPHILYQFDVDKVRKNSQFWMQTELKKPKVPEEKFMSYGAYSLVSAKTSAEVFESALFDDVKLDDKIPF